jgi:hypothetical protein
VDWRVPMEQAQAESAWVTHFARMWYAPAAANSGAPAAAIAWLRPWLVANATGRDAALVFLPLLCALAFEAALHLTRQARAAPRPWGLAAPALLGLGFWFLAAPRPSLAIAPAWVLAGIAAARFFGRPGPARLARSGPGVVALLLLVVTVNAVRSRGDPTSIRTWRETLLTYPDPLHWFREPADPQLEDFVTRSGLVLHVPAQRNLCRRAPLPCTPHPAPNLRLRMPGDLRHGFAIDGAWMPSRWPNPASRFLDAWRTARRRRRR